MGNSKIEQLIDDFNDLIDDCKPAPFSKTNISVPRDAVEEFLDQLRVCTPDEIKRYQKIISNRDSIIKEAENKAAEIINKAEEKAEQLVSENDIFQRACARANEVVGDANLRAEAMISEATNEANRVLYEANRDSDKIRTGALAYANEMLGEIENAVGNAYESIAAKSEMVVGTLKANLDILIDNRRELNGEAAPAEPLPEEDMLSDSELTDMDSVEDEVLEFDENTFLNDANEE